MFHSISFRLTPSHSHSFSLAQLAELFAKFSGVLEEYEERRAERMQRMQSEVSVALSFLRLALSALGQVLVAGAHAAHAVRGGLLC